MAAKESSKRRVNFKDLTGQVFGHLVVIGLQPERTSNGSAKWNCRCACGELTIVIGQELRKKSTASCGKCIYRSAALSAANAIHGMCESKEYKSWDGAKQRCFNSRCRQFRNYGGRGIAMSKEWRVSFDAFYRDMGPCPDGMTLDRIDNNGPYTGPCAEYPSGNCRWATSIEQCRNTRCNVLITHGDETHTLIEWAERTGIHENTIRRRQKAGRPLFAPPRRWKS